MDYVLIWLLLMASRVWKWKLVDKNYILSPSNTPMVSPVLPDICVCPWESFIGENTLLMALADESEQLQLRMACIWGGCLSLGFSDFEPPVPACSSACCYSDWLHTLCISARDHPNIRGTTLPLQWHGGGTWESRPHQMDCLSHRNLWKAQGLLVVGVNCADVFKSVSLVTRNLLCQNDRWAGAASPPCHFPGMSALFTCQDQVLL